MKLKMILAGAALAATALGTTTSHAAAIVALPGNANVQYLDSAVPAGTLVTVVSLDPTVGHTVYSTIKDKKPRAWCGPGKPFSADSCPLFYSAKVEVGDSAPVTGTDKLVPGDYGFYCSLHPASQKGTLHVL